MQQSLVLLAFLLIAPSDGAQVFLDHDPVPAPRPKLRASATAWLEKTENVLSSAFHEAEGRVTQEVRFARDFARNATEHGAPEGRRQQMYFRPVSVTLICVISLTFICLIVYTALAIARNADELSGQNEPSIYTETLSAASRITAFPPMMCMLFVGCRMYVLATTEGLGEPPLWVKTCMIVASVGIALQLVVVMVLPCLTKRDKDEKFSELAGETIDVHPLLNSQTYTAGGLKSGTWCFQALCLLAIYGGIVGVAVGIFTYPKGTTAVSPAVICTVILSALYFSTYLTLFSVRSSTDADGPNRSMRRAAQCAVNCVQKAPMLAVLFLAARMRALQLDPPHGMPPLWAQICFFTMTGMLVLETLAAAYVGATGEESHGYYGYHLYQANPAAHIVQHACGLVIYLCLIPVIVAIFLMQPAAGGVAPLSPMMIAVLWLTGLYFGVGLCKWVIFFLQDVCKKTYKTAQETVLAAGISIAFCPLLCILFVACRMRALQISQQEGNPQGWAQDCFYICVFATFTQACCCLAMPIFTGAATQVDGDGNSSYDLRPMVGAYAVCMVKYVALLCLHGGVLAVTISIFTITPEMAMAKHDSIRGMKEILIGIMIVLLLLLIATLLSSAKAVGMAIKMGIESGAPLVLGVDMVVKKANLSVCEGYVNVAGVVMQNPPVPEGHDDWKTPHLMRVDEMCVKLNMGKLVTSCGGKFEITTAVLQGVDVIYEKNIGQKSNMDLVVEHIANLVKEAVHEAGLDKPAPPPPPPDPNAPKKTFKERMHDLNELRKTMAKMPKIELKPPDLIMRELKIEDVAAKALIQGAQVEAELGNICIQDFMEEKCPGKESCSAGDVISVVVTVICNSVLQNRKIFGQSAAVVEHVAAELAHEAKDAVASAGHAMAEGLKSFSKRFSHIKKAEDEPESAPTESAPLTPRSAQEEAEPAK